MAATNLDATITRAEFDSAIERLAGRMTTLESMGSPSRRAESMLTEDPREFESDVVTQNEFRLFKWLGTFALAAVLAGFGILYQQTTDLRVDMQQMHGDLLNGILKEMNAQHTDIRGEIGTLRERVVRVDTRLEGVEMRVAGVETRLEGVETRLGGVETRLGSVETRLGSVETRLGSVETRLGSVETRLGSVETRLEGSEVTRARET